jgi:hypothetical protein
VRIDQIYAVGPAGVGMFGRVAKFVENGGELYAKLSYTRPGDVGALVFASWATEDDFVFDVALHLPYVAGMRFRDVNDQKADATAILLVEFVESGSLPPERRSRVTAEYQYHWLVLVQLGKLKPSALVYFH